MPNPNLSNRPQNKNFGTRVGRVQSVKVCKENHSVYYADPNYCDLCHTILPYEKRKNKFCDSSCAASLNNTKRPPRKKPKPPFCRVTFRRCLICNNFFRAQRGKTKYCSDDCQQCTQKSLIDPNALFARIGLIFRNFIIPPL